MTLQQFQNNVHLLYQGNTDTPATDSDSWDLRTGLLEAAINMWESEEGVEWDELWVLLSDAATGDKTTNGTDSEFDAPLDFKKPGGYLYLTDTAGQKTWYKFLKPHEVQYELITQTGAKYFWVTGNAKTGFTINLSDTPTTGQTIEYPYYKTAFVPSTTTDSIEMNDAWFAIHFALAQLQAGSENGDKATLQLSIASQKLKAMKFRNATSPNGQSARVRDYDFNSGFGGFGQ